MSLRPRPARWFELLVSRGSAVRAATCLAASGVVEVEAVVDGPAHGDALERGVARFRDLARRHGRYWPVVAATPPSLTRSPRHAMAAALRRLDRWARQGEARIRTVQGLEAERDRLRRWQELLPSLASAGVDVAALLSSGPAPGAGSPPARSPAGGRRPGRIAPRSSLRRPTVRPEGEAVRSRARFPSLRSPVADRPLAMETIILPEAAAPGSPPRPLLALRLPLADGRVAVVVVGPAAMVAREVARLVELRGRHLTRPAWLTGADPVGRLAARLAQVEQEIERGYVALFTLAEALHLAEAITDLRAVAWFVERVGPVAGTPLFARITGWTPDSAAMVRAVEWEGIAALLALPAPPPGVRPPSLLVNRPWVRPFELFARALGTPGEGEVDPSPMLAVVVPLLFGYMFGDVGHGVVLAVAGSLLWRRGPVWRLLAVGGVAAAGFGLLFGSLFCREGVIPPLWIHPLDQPITLLSVPVAGAVVLLAGGLLLAGVEAAWVGEGGRWLREEAGLLLLYLGLAGGLLFRPLFGLAVAAVVYHLAAALFGGRWSAPAPALARLVEEAQRLLVNTVSFARVGAFALAHAGLASAVATLAHAAGPASPLIWIAGNLLVIGLEGLVVSIQTTRLVLFELFARFLRGEGRPFRPLAPPLSQGAS